MARVRRTFSTAARQFGNAPPDPRCERTACDQIRPRVTLDRMRRTTGRDRPYRLALWLAFALALLLAEGCSGPASPPAGTTKVRAEDLSNRKRLNPVLLGNVDRVGESAPQNGRAVLSMGGKSEIEVTGWAVDRIGAGVGSKMMITVNGQTIGCDYGTPRPDVAAALHSDAYTNSGYTCHLPLNMVKAGENTLQPVLAMGDASYYAAEPIIATATP